MNIGMLAPPWLPVPPPAYGGTESVVDLLSRGLDAAGHAVTLFATGDSTCPVVRRWCYEEAQTNRMGLSLPEARQVVAGYDALASCDVIHDHTVVGPLLGPGWYDGPIVTTAHGPLDDEASGVYAVRDPSVALVAISHAQREMAPHLRVDAVIHHGIEVERFPVGGGDGGYVLFLGRMSPDKGPHRALDAARVAGIPIRLAGKMREPGEREYFRTEVEPRLGPDAEYLGEVGEDEKVGLLADAMALVNPILWPEPFGLVMIEALACGTPVVAYPYGAAPEIVDHGATGYLVRDGSALADALRHIGDIDRARCRSAAASRFDLAGMVAAHVALYQRLQADGLPRVSVASGP